MSGLVLFSGAGLVAPFAGLRADMPKASGMLAVTMIRSGKRVGFACSVCRLREFQDDATAAKAARMLHVASPAHRSSLRAARRE